jgi:hypothetical protein
MNAEADIGEVNTMTTTIGQLLATTLDKDNKICSKAFKLHAAEDAGILLLGEKNMSNLKGWAI